MTSLDESRSVPLYRQLADLLGAEIASGVRAPGSRIPSERELAESYQVSRMTARQAMLLLQRTGQIATQAGKGTFVLGSATSLQAPAPAATGPNAASTQPAPAPAAWEPPEVIAPPGMRLADRLLRAEIAPADARVAGELAIAPGDEVVFLQRLCLVDGKPGLLESLYLPHALCPGVLERAEAGTGDGSELGIDNRRAFLAERYGVAWGRTAQSITASLPDKADRKALSMEQGEPVLLVERVGYDESGRAVEYLRGVYNSDRYPVRSWLSRAAVGG